MAVQTRVDRLQSANVWQVIGVFAVAMLLGGIVGAALMGLDTKRTADQVWSTGCADGAGGKCAGYVDVGSGDLWTFTISAGSVQQHVMCVVRPSRPRPRPPMVGRGHSGPPPGRRVRRL